MIDYFQGFILFNSPGLKEMSLFRLEENVLSGAVKNGFVKLINCVAVVARCNVLYSVCLKQSGSRPQSDDLKRSNIFPGS